MANLSKVIYINEVDYSTLLNGGTITKGGVTYSHDPTALYVIKNVSAPEYAETAGYATTAGQATKATQDGNGDVITGTYAKKAIIGTLTYNSQTDTWTCNKTHEELINAILAGNLVYLTAPGWSNQLYYPKRYPYPDGNGDYSGDLLFQSLESGGYCERFSIYDDNSIENEEIDFESYLNGEGYFKQRIILKLTIGNNNTLSFKDQDDQDVNIDEANWLIRRSQDNKDVVIQYDGLEYHKSYFYTNSSITFSSADQRNINYLIFDCSNTSTISLVNSGSIDLSNIVRSISVPGQVKLPSSGIISLVDEFNAKEDAQKVLIRANIITGDNPTISFTDVNNNNLTHLEVHQLLENYKKDVVFYRGNLYYILQYSSSNGREYYYQNFEGDQGTFHYFFIYWDSTNNTFSVEVEDIDYTRLSDIKYVVSGTIYNSSTVQNPTKNFNQIKSAYDAGKLVVFIDSQDKYEYYCIKCDSSEAIFFNSDAIYGLFTVKVTSSNVWSVDITEIPSASTTAPKMDGTAAIGSSTSYARADHVHPSDTSKMSTSHPANAITSAKISQWDNKADTDTQQVVIQFNATDDPLEFTDINDNTITHAQFADLCNDTSKTVLLRDNDNDVLFRYGGFYDDTNSWAFLYTWRKGTITIALQRTNGVISVDSYHSYSFDDIYQYKLVSGTNIKTINNQSLLGSGNLTASDIGALPSNTHIPNDIKVGSVAGKLYRDDVDGGGNFTVRGNSGCIPNLTAGTFIVSIYAKSETQSYTFRFNFGSVSYDLSTTNSEINDTREITIPSNGTFSGSVLNGSVASGTILYVVMYNYLTPVSTVGVAAVTNRYADLDGTPNIPTVPTNISSFTNDVGYITSTAITDLTNIL